MPYLSTRPSCMRKAANNNKQGLRCQKRASWPYTSPAAHPQMTGQVAWQFAGWFLCQVELLMPGKILVSHSVYVCRQPVISVALAVRCSIAWRHAAGKG